MTKAPAQFQNLQEFRGWFETHVTLDGEPYRLDPDQARAVYDNHKNTLITARAGSGKTRVIVAKIAYLVASEQANLKEIAAFMFNRTAAAEVNQRISTVAVDGRKLSEWYGKPQSIKVASTFHKYALDLVKLIGERPVIISEAEQNSLIENIAKTLLHGEFARRLTPTECRETIQLIKSFIARAGQKFSGPQGLSQLCQVVEEYCKRHANQVEYQQRIWLHRLALATYEDYLLKLSFPRIDFNLLMGRATSLLSAEEPNAAQRRVAPLRYILVDEYQDFSDLFFNLIQAIRGNCPKVHLFAVGDDWQAINRFAGSDVDYFINFQHYFPEDTINIPLVTNYRSAKRIVENANKYMLKHYDRKAKKAQAFNRKRGKIRRINIEKTKFDQSDLHEDALGDARYQLALTKWCGGNPANYQAAAQLLKTVYKIIKRRCREPILLLHRHNFTSFAGVNLDGFMRALQQIVVEQNIMSEENFTERVRCMTMHKSKGLESETVILLEANREQLYGAHPHATTFALFGDTREAEIADQYRLLYVALTRAKRRLYILRSERKSVI